MIWADADLLTRLCISKASFEQITKNLITSNVAVLQLSKEVRKCEILYKYPKDNVL